MALPSGSYAPREPAASVRYQVVRDHYQTFRVEAAGARDGEGLPRFVVDEFEAFLRCGWLPTPPRTVRVAGAPGLAGGFARFRCAGCRAERLVAKAAGSVPRVAGAA